MMQRRASESPGWRLATIGLVIAGLAIPFGQGWAASAAVPAPIAGPGCGVPGGVQLALRPGLVRADRKAQRRPARPPEPEPQAAEEPPATFMHAYFTCAALPIMARPVGQGWLAVGPVRKG